MDSIKEAFQKVKEDMFYLKQEIYSLRNELINLREDLENSIQNINQTTEELKNLVKNSTPTVQQIIPTLIQHPTDNPTHNLPLKDLKGQNTLISIGNEGVPTDSQQTVRQTDRPILYEEKPSFVGSIEEATKLLDSLDNIKKDLRLKFKRLTDQEVLIFSTIYQLEEEGKKVDYKLVAEKLGLSESSIRDYVSRLIKKGISVEKNKINNKTILLTISGNLKKIATLNTMLRLRDL